MTTPRSVVPDIKGLDPCAIIAVTSGAAAIAIPMPFALFAFAFAGIGIYRGYKNRVPMDLVVSLAGVAQAIVGIVIGFLS